MRPIITPKPASIVVYWTLAAVLIGGFAWAYAADPPPFTYAPDSDLWEHSAAIREWMRDLWHPRNPHLMSDAGSPRYMPYFFVLAVAGKILGLETIGVLRIAGLFNIVLLTLGIFLFFRAHFRSELAPVIGLIVLLTAWGAAWTWSNVYQIRALFYVGPYPSTFCFALTLVCLWLQTLVLRAPNPQAGRYIALTVLVAVLVASHPLTGAFAVASLMLLALLHPKVEAKVRAGAMIAVAAGLGLAELWPYYSVFRVTLGVSGGEAKSWIDAGEFAWHARARTLLDHPFYDPNFVLVALGPLLAGFVCLGLLVRRREHWFIPAGALAMLAPYVVNLVYPIPLGHRFLLFAIFFLHLALVWAALLCLDRVSRGKMIRAAPFTAKVALGGLGTAIAAGLFFNIFLAGIDSWQRLAKRTPVSASIGQIVRSVPHDGVVMARPLLAWPIPTFAGKVVSLFHRNPMVPDSAARSRDVAMFFDPEASESKRTQILRSYGVSHVLIDTADTPAEVRSYLSSVGTVEDTLGNLQLIEVRLLSAEAK